MTFLPLPLGVQAVLTAVVVGAALFHLRHRQAPGWLAIAGVAAGFTFHMRLESWAGLELAAWGTGLALVIYIPLLAARGAAGSEVRLMASVGALAGARNWLGIFAITTIIWGLLALATILLKGRLHRTLSDAMLFFRHLVSLHPPHRRHPDAESHPPEAIHLPHTALIALGTLLFLFVIR